MSLVNTIRDARALHAYVAVFLIAVLLTVLGHINELQLFIVTAFAGFVSLIDSMEGLARSIDSVDSQLAEVNGQLDRVNDDEPDRDQ